MQITEPPVWLVIPFVSLLLLIAIGPVLFAKFWHRWYKHLSLGLGSLVGLSYVFFLRNTHIPIETLAEYLSFISLLIILYVASGGIYLFVDVESKAITNIVFLVIAAILTNLIGTTGASVLFIRPYMRINRYRLRPYHIIFFIFIVSNIAGSLTPIGDPPLFMGFLKGVPFFWTFGKMVGPWFLTLTFLLIIFYFFERNNTELDEVDVSSHFSGKIILNGKRNLIWLAIGIGSVFLDPQVFESIPYLDFHGKKLSFIRELVQLSCAALCYRFANKHALLSNDFDFEPIKEVAWLFIGIFLCMMPALQLLEVFAHAQGNQLHLSPGLIFWSSGIFSSLLDNAPTYLNILALLLSNQGLSLNEVAQVRIFVNSSGQDLLAALSAGAVFFGAMTYIGNGPNFMVKSIAEQAGVKMPGFGAYLGRYSLPILLPVMVFIWLLYFN